jgi:hypothetical protein
VRGHRKIVENLSACVHLLLRVAPQMPLITQVPTAKYRRDVFFVVKPYRAGHHSFIKASRPCHDASLQKAMDRGEGSGGRDMQLHEYRAKLSAIRSFAAPAQCPHCGDVMVAPVSSEFVEGGEIRHHWECEACGGLSSTSIPLTSH